MITLLVGSNRYEIAQALQHIEAAFSGTPERIDGEAVELWQLPELLAGATLFSEKRLVIVHDLSENTAVWSQLESFLPRLDDDVHLVLVETSLDKRTKLYKALHAVADIHEYKAWTERDGALAVAWVAATATRRGLSLDRKLADHLVRRVGVDQWMLAGALDKLALLDVVTAEAIDDTVEPNPTENVFQLFELALSGKSQQLRQVLATLEQTEDPYRLFGLLAGQVFQLAALAAGEPAATVAKDIGAHPFVLSKLAPYASRLGATGTRQVVMAFSEADVAMKTSVADPWLLVERALAKTAQLQPK